MPLKTSPYPLQRGISVHCPPLEGAGGGKNAFDFGKMKY